MDDDTLDELGYHLAIAAPADRRDLFLAMAAEHQALAAELADLLVELILHELREERPGVDDIEPAVADDDPAVRRAMMRFTAALRRQRPDGPDPCPTPDASSRESTPQ